MFKAEDYDAGRQSYPAVSKKRHCYAVKKEHGRGGMQRKKSKTVKKAVKR